MSNTDTKHVLTAAMVAAYHNAQVMHKITKNIHEVGSILSKDNKIALAGSYTFSNVSDFQLVLTSPDKISDAQALEVAKEYYPLYPTWHTVSHGMAIVKERDVEELDTCRAYNIDKGYKSIPSLIAAGLAVEKTH